MWSGKNKIKLFGQMYVCNGEGFIPKNTVPTVTQLLSMV